MNDGYEVENELDPLMDDAALDPDEDGLSNLVEANNGTNAQRADTDGDEMPDAFEIANRLNPLLDDRNGDLDFDGLTNLTELQLGTHANDADTDNDGMPDGYEVDNTLDPLFDDAGEDADSDGLTNLRESTIGTSARITDTDRDGLPDRYEDETPGFNPLASGDALADFDADFLTNIVEFANGTDPNDTDTDDDGLLDGFEVSFGLNALDDADNAEMDSDGDGLSNGEEQELEASYPVDPLDPGLPRDEWVVSAASGSDARDVLAGGGTGQEPWRTIAFALLQVAPLARENFPVRVLLDDTPTPGDGFARYVEGGFVIESFMTVQDADLMNSLEVRLFKSGDSIPPVFLVGAENGTLRGVRLLPPVDTSQSDLILLRINDVSLTVDQVTFDGQLLGESIGIFIDGPDSSDTLIRNCRFINLGTGIQSTNSGVAVSDNSFENITGRAIRIGFTVEKQSGTTPVLGRIDNILETGFNRFRFLSGNAIEFLNVPPEITSAEYNDWGVYTPEEIAGLIGGSVKQGGETVDFEPFITEDKALEQGSITGIVLDGQQDLPIDTALMPGVSQTGAGAFAMAAEDGLFVFPAVLPGTYNLRAAALGYNDSDVVAVEVVSGGVAQAPRFLLAPDGTPVDDPADLNDDDTVDAVDVQLVINGALGISADVATDVNGDDETDAVDVQLVINAALGLG